MQALVYGLGFCAVALLVYMARYSGRLRVTQTCLIDASPAAVYALVSDFGQWRAWCPWLEHEPDAALLRTTSGGRERLAWSGARCGEGSAEHVRLLHTTRIEQRLRLCTPFRFHGRGSWEFKPQQDRTEVSWSFRGRVGFATRAFAPTVQAMVALDLRHGLARLARVLEGESAAQGKLSYLGKRDVAALRYACATHQGPLEGLGAALREERAALRQRLAGLGVPTVGDPIAAYLRTHIKRRTTLCEVGLPIGDASVGDLPVRELPAHSAYVVRVEGSPVDLEVAWYQAMQRLRIEGAAPDPRLPPYERQLHEGGDDAVTDLCIPVLP